MPGGAGWQGDNPWDELAGEPWAHVFDEEEEQEPWGMSTHAPRDTAPRARPAGDSTPLSMNVGIPADAEPSAASPDVNAGRSPGDHLFRLNSHSVAKVALLTGTAYGIPEEFSSAAARDLFFNGLSTGARLIELRLMKAAQLAALVRLHFDLLKQHGYRLLSEARLKQYIEEIHLALQPGLEQMDGIFGGKMTADEVRRNLARAADGMEVQLCLIWIVY